MQNGGRCCRRSHSARNICKRKKCDYDFPIKNEGIFIVTLLETVRELKSLGVDVFFEEQNIYTLSAEGEVMLTLLASFAQAESLSCSDNCKWRIRKGFEEGRASTCTMLGYRLINGEITLIEDEAKIAKRIFDLYLAGYGLQKIANILNEEGLYSIFGNEWHPTTLRKVLTNEKYCGDLLLQKRDRVPC